MRCGSEEKITKTNKVYKNVICETQLEFGSPHSTSYELSREKSPVPIPAPLTESRVFSLIFATMLRSRHCS